MQEEEWESERGRYFRESAARVGVDSDEGATEQSVSASLPHAGDVS